MLEVSVAWVRLEWISRLRECMTDKGLLRVKVQMGPIDLIEAPQQILGGSVDIVAS